MKPILYPFFLYPTLYSKVGSAYIVQNDAKDNVKQHAPCKGAIMCEN